jgi:FkbM family methyltransferase
MPLLPWLRYRPMAGQQIVLDLADPVQFQIAREGYVYEPETTRFLESQLSEGGAFVDVGANWGYYTCFAAHRVGPTGLVVAIEPHRGNYSRLQQTLSRNRIQNAVAVNAAAWVNNGNRVKMVKPWYRQTTGAYIGGNGGSIQTRTVDSIVSQTVSGRPVKAVKIDVEGAELLVLQGMRATLKAHRPALVVETSGLLFRFGHDFKQLYDYLGEFGYKPRLHIEDRVSPYIRPYSPGDETHGQVVFN